MERGDTYYWARIMPEVDVYEIIELKIRTVEEKWFSGSCKRDKRAYIFPKSAIDKTVLLSRDLALKMVINAEKNRTKVLEKEETDIYE